MSRSAGGTCVLRDKRDERAAYEQARTGRDLFSDTARRMRGLLKGDASAGPNPGGGFYGGPNLNVGRINP
jgi:hypothetical protein